MYALAVIVLNASVSHHLISIIPPHNFCVCACTRKEVRVNCMRLFLAHPPLSMVLCGCKTKPTNIPSRAPRISAFLCVYTPYLSNTFSSHPPHTAPDSTNGPCEYFSVCYICVLYALLYLCVCVCRNQTLEKKNNAHAHHKTKLCLHVVWFDCCVFVCWRGVDFLPNVFTLSVSLFWSCTDRLERVVG